MAALLGARAGFQTGDIIITYVPGADKRPLHMTVYLEGAHSPSREPAFVHAANDGVIIEGFGGYAEMPKYRRARRGGELGKAASEAAKVWATDRTIGQKDLASTPYGSTPGSKQSLTKELRANRFSAMMQTASIASIPLDVTALVRLMKWTLRLHEKTPLSINRGITCAAFVAACHQAAAMRLFLRDAGVLEKLDKALMGKIDGKLETKKDLRLRVPLEEAEKIEGVEWPKPILKGAALRANSNRAPLPGLVASLNQARTRATNVNNAQAMQDQYPTFFPNLASLATATDTDYFWLKIQTGLFGIHDSMVCRLSDVIPDDFYYDAKYVNSVLLNQLMLASPHWATVDYDVYAD
ncbi:hypothetical protein [Sandaracinobacteroides saxicola]|uniref:Uncharacterized protein n=1 Tax=Sandaracinobacteroides saxicola TaxID=2759707 RepID=A0A7G5IF11_9SPHN|nr:hypothetical protein [Sandaracinobacteroides saxicola]QMW21953.1 hypothetical protein H3309_11240 [Sandaracinobacteroides saxicola]